MTYNRWVIYLTENTILNKNPFQYAIFIFFVAIIILNDLKFLFFGF